MNIGDYVYTLENGEKKFGQITNIIDHDYLLIKFPNKSHDVSVHKEKIGLTYFMSDKASAVEHKKSVQSKAKSYDTLEAEEQACADQIINSYQQKLDDLDKTFYQRDRYYELVAFESVESINRKKSEYKKILSDPFKYHLYYTHEANEIDIRLGTYSIEIEGTNIIIHSLNSPIYGELLMKNRLGQSEIEINDEIYYITSRRDVKFNGASKNSVINVTEVKFDHVLTQMTLENMDRYLIDTLSQDELYQTRLKTNSQELQEIFWSMTGTQFQIIREEVDTPLIIQGGAGTGKTSVGVHRLSYLFYNKLIKHAIALGPNEHFSHFLEDSLSNIGIQSEYNIETLSRLEFYIRYYKEIQSTIIEKTTTINELLMKSNLNPLLLSHSLPNNSPSLTNTTKNFKKLTKNLHTFMSWDKLLQQLNQIESLLNFKKTTSIQSIEDLLNSLEQLLKLIDTNIQYYRLKETIQTHELQLKMLTTEYEEMLEQITLNISESHSKSANLDALNEKLKQSEEQFFPIKKKYMYYSNQLSNFQINHNEISSKLNSLFSSGVKKQFELSTQLLDVCTTLVENLKEQFDKADFLHQQLTEQVNTLTKELTAINEALNTSKIGKKNLQNKITIIQETLQNEQQEFISLNPEFILSQSQISTFQTMIAEFIDNVNLLTPTSFFKTQSRQLDQNNILLWIHFYFMLFPSVKEKYQQTYFFIDEAQDLSLFELHLFHHINSKFITLVGDVNQNIFGYNNLTNWDNVCSLYKAKFYELQYNWRSTKPIVKEAHQFMTNYDYKNLGIISGYPTHEQRVSSLEELSNILNKEWLLEKINFLPDGKSCAIIALNKTQLSFLKLLLKPLMNNDSNKELIDVFDGTGTIHPKRITLTSIDYVKGLEFFSVIIPLPYTDDFDQFQKARVYTALTRATDDLTVFLIDEQ